MANMFQLRLLVALLFLAAAGSAYGQTSDSTGNVFIYPEEQIVSLNDTFSIYIAVDTVLDVKSYFFDVEVDTTVIKMIGASREPFFNGPSGAFFFWTDTTHVFSGTRVSYVYELLASLFGPLVNVDGPGRLLKMTFVAVGHGASGVLLRQSDILDELNTEIVMDDSLHGLVVVCPTGYRFGDNNYNGVISISDVVYLINYIFSGGPAPLPIHLVADVNCSSVVSISDAVFLIKYIFAGGPPPCSPCP
jgi:hypothetical protein